MAHHWQAPDRPELGFMNGISGIFRSAELRGGHALPDIRAGSQLVIGSDYSGQHKTSAYEAMSFLIADWSSSTRWHAAQSAIRDSMPDDRRFGFKHMNDGIRLAALPRLLTAADTISGLLFVILIRKSLGPLFTPRVDLDFRDEQLKPVARWPAATTERALAACEFVSLLLAGLSRPGQHILWITDADDIVANELRHRQFVELFGALSGNYIDHALGHLRIATTASDNGNRGVEDFVSITDLAAGAVCDTLNAYDQARIKIPKDIVIPVPEGLKPTSHLLMSWFASKGAPLKRLTVSIEPGSTPRKLLLSHHEFPTMPRPL